MDDDFVILQAPSTGVDNKQEPLTELSQNRRSGLPALRYYRIPRTLTLWQPDIDVTCRAASPAYWMKFLSRSNASTGIAVDRTRYLSVASVFHHVQPINHLAPLVPVYPAQGRQSFLNVLIDL